MTRNLLIIEDDPGLKSFFEKVLGHRGYGLTIVDTIADIDSAVENKVYDYIFCDIELGEHNNMDFITYAGEQSLPIIVISANEEYIKQCLSVGVLAFVVKPILALDLLELAEGNFNLKNTRIYLPAGGRP